LKQLAPVSLNLGPQAGSFVYTGGKWNTRTAVEGGSGSGSEPSAGEVQRLKEENNLLNLKVDILLEMLALANLDMDVVKERLERSRTPSS